MSKTTSRKSSPATLSVDYTPEVKAARDQVVKAATAFKAYAKRGDATILPQCVEATRVALASGFLVDGRDADALPGSVNGKAYAAMFGLSSGSDVSFWKRLSRAIDAGMTVGDDLWKMLALAEGGTARMAKNAAVAKVIDEGGSLAEIAEACEQVQAERDRKAATRKARVADGSSDTESAPEGIPVSDDPVADALLAILGLDAAAKRIPVEDAEGWGKVRKAITALMRRESTLRKTAPKVAA